jgi:adenylate cyclase
MKKGPPAQQALEEVIRAARGLQTSLRRLQKHLRAMPPDATTPPDTEVERKYLLRALPPHARTGSAQALWQGYLPGEKLQERLRRVKDARGERHYRTVKLGRGLSRIEVEEETEAWLFRRLWPLTLGKRVKKRRWVVEAGAFTWEVDEFLDRKLVLAEVELPSAAAVAPLPPWLAPYVIREVTDEDAYVNINLAR